MLGPSWLRIGLGVVAFLYFTALIVRPRDHTGLHAIRFFTEATCLFPKANTIAQEHRLEAWQCGGEAWTAMDPRPYFPIRPDDKESRFQRLGYFYDRNRTVMRALDDYIIRGHAAGASDGVSGPIGGIRLVKVARQFPPPGDPVERYAFDPFAPIPADQRRDQYYTPTPERKRRCTSR